MLASVSRSNAIVLAIVAVVAVCGQMTHALVENARFCICTEPLALIDTQGHVNPRDNDPQCEILVNTLTMQEKTEFIAALCKDLKEEYHLLQMRNGELAGHASHHEICNGKRNPLLAWLNYSVAQRSFVNELNPTEHANYIGKVCKTEEGPIDFCRFKHSNLVGVVPADTCVSVSDAEKEHPLNGSISILIEIQPIMYEVRNLSYTPIINSTATYKTELGKAVLRNRRGEAKQIFGSLDYAYVEKIKLNVPSVYGDQLEKLPLLFEHKGAVVELDHQGVGGVQVREKAYFGRMMDAKSSVNVEVVGQWAQQRRQFNADIYDYFGYGIKRFRQEMHNGEVGLILIESTEPVFDMLESTHIVVPRLHVENRPKPEETESTAVTAGHYPTVSAGMLERLDEVSDTDDDDTRKDGHPYPGFYPWFVCACIVIAVAVIAVMIGMVRSRSKQKRKRDYKLTAA